MARDQDRRRAPPQACGDTCARLRMLTAQEIADRCGLSLRTVRRIIASGVLPVHRFGRAVRVSEADLERFLASRRTPIRVPPEGGGRARKRPGNPRS